MAGESTPRSGGCATPLGRDARGAARLAFAAMETTELDTTRNAVADLDLLLAEADRDAAVLPAPVPTRREPETVDAFNAQILAGLVSP